MSTASPSAFLLWAVLSVMFQVFLVYHIWCYDKFKCLHWSSGRQPGAFKRIMTYSYLFSVPLLAVFSVATTVIKFQEGFIVMSNGQIVPKPLRLYSSHNRAWIIPLDLVFSAVWALELVTHLEELAFWLYLLHQNPQKEEWFSSWEYRLWYLGSVVSVIGLPLTAIVTRKNIETCDAYIFLVGASGSTFTTICFLYVIWRFPAFIAHVKAEGAEPTVVVRLATFYQLNLARIVFRFLFTIPLMVLAADGVMAGPHTINRNVFWTDFLHMVGGIGCFVSSTITLLIFFPRSIVNESGYRPKPPTVPASSPKMMNPDSPNFNADYAGGYPNSPSYPGYFPESAMPSPEYIVDMRPEDINSHYPYLQGGARSMSDETGEFEEDNDSVEDDDEEVDKHHVDPPDSTMPPTHRDRRMSPIIPPMSSQPHSPEPQTPSTIQSATSQLRKPGQAGALTPPTRLRRLGPSQPTPDRHNGVYQRHPFTHSPSSPQVAYPAPSTPPREQVIIDMTPRLRDLRAGHHRRNSSRRVSATMQSTGEVLQPTERGVGLGVSVPEEEDASMVTLRDIPPYNGRNPDIRRDQDQSRPPSSLHPYVTTFTSPIDLVDIPVREAYPHAM